MKACFTLILTILSITVFAQRNLVPGYYITKSGEKVEAQVNDLNWDRNPTFVEVMKDGKLQRLGMADIQGFGISSGDMYDVFVVDVDKSPTKLNDIKPNSQPLIERDTVFLRAVVKGAASLYYLKDENAKEHYYIRKGDEQPAELIYRITKYESNGKMGYTKLPIYRGLLSSTLTDCPDVTNKLSKLNYNRKSLSDFVEAYNQCIGTNGFVYKSYDEGTKWNIAVTGGLTYSTLKFSGSESRSLYNGKYNDTNFTLGVTALVTLPRGRGKWAIQGDLLYKPFKAEDSYSYNSIGSIVRYTHETVKFDLGYVGLNTSVRYRFLDSKVKPYLNAGIANNLLIYESNSQQITYQSFEDIDEKKPLDEMRKHEQALLLGVGVELKKLAAEVKLESGNGFSPYVGLKSARNTVSVILSYTLK
ncbi:outer membrane beta-barrel protein [Pontibacter cellulosilyticus]|uniref:PorT family protein n=1 Tax=Pontibacter cellulosilyticus TaxID=1720253 RepID=A0A923SLM8_9BACT|nr:outer membrane beta-barrel protein [Pontibacter cellulosilyticus]MBC5991315.1 PorT family protein [Pontibacter cellulosilyticus]